MSELAFTAEHRVAVPGGTVWVGVVGDLSAGLPLLTIHGGPGMSHVYLAPLADLADGRAVIFYDQLDAGRSDRPNLPENWRIERFLAEIDAIRAALGLERLALFGNSWGGTLAAAYGARQPAGLERLVLSSPLIHTETWLKDNAAYRAALPPETLAVMDRYEAMGETDDPAYLDAVDLFYRRHLCRTDPWPAWVNRTFELLNESCYAGMWGPNEFTCTGVLSGYDGRPGLAEIAVPTLVTCGAYDEATPESCRHFAAMIPGAELAVIEDASHMAFIERRDVYMARLRPFLA